VKEGKDEVENHRNEFLKIYNEESNKGDSKDGNGSTVLEEIKYKQQDMNENGERNIKITGLNDTGEKPLI